MAEARPREPFPKVLHKEVGRANTSFPGAPKMEAPQNLPVPPSWKVRRVIQRHHPWGMLSVT